MMNIETIATLRARETEQPYIAWLDALSEGLQLMHEANVDEHVFRLLTESCQSPKQFSIVLEALYEHSKEHPEAPNGFRHLIALVEASVFTLTDWIEALDYFYDWLGQIDQKSPGLISLLDNVGYFSHI